MAGIASCRDALVGDVLVPATEPWRGAPGIRGKTRAGPAECKAVTQLSRRFLASEKRIATERIDRALR